MGQDGIIIESCCTSVAEALAAQGRGADRIELCADLSVGGVTPDEDTVRRAAGLCSIPVNVLVRPRGGGFVYGEDEVRSMLDAIALCKAAGANGVVTGALDASGRVDMAVMRRLVAAARPLEVTFHRAFDECSDPFACLEDIISLGCERLLTSGLAATAPEGAETISSLVRRSSGRIVILAGSGVTPGNLEQLVDMTGVREVHGTRIP